MGTLADLFAGELQGYQPTDASLELAVRHVPGHMRSGLDDQNPWRHRNALGHLYQSVLYDQIHSICDRVPSVTAFVRQFNDVPFERRTRGSPGQNGFFYTTEGQIVVRGDGYDQGEFDALVFGNDGSLLLVEMVLSKLGLRDIAQEVDQKRYLLKLMLSKDADFLILTPLEVGGIPQIKELLRDSRNRVVRTGDIGTVPKDLASKASSHGPPHSCAKGILLSEVKANPFDYAAVHARLRGSFLKALGEGGELATDVSEARLVKSIFVGSLDGEAVNYILSAKSLMIGSSRLTASEYHSRCSRMVMVLTWPELRPKLYLRAKRVFPRWGPNYLKLGPWSQQAFGFERNVFRKRTAFFNLLESTTSALGKQQTELILNRYLRPEVSERRKKIGESPIW